MKPDGDRTFQAQHAVEDVDGDIHLGHPTRAWCKDWTLALRSWVA